MATLATLIGETEKELSMYGGAGVQLYAEDKIAQSIQKSFNRQFRKRWWERHELFETLTLDGTTGLHTGDLSTKIKDIQDLHFVWHGTDDEPLDRAPRRLNPSAIKQVCFLPLASNTQKWFKIYPIDTTGNVTVAYRTQPADYTSTDEVDFDADYLVYAAAAEYVMDDDASRSAMQKFQGLAAERLKILEDNEISRERSKKNYGAASVLTEWTS